MKLKAERDQKRAALEERLALMSDVEESDQEMQNGNDEEESEEESSVEIPEEFREIEVKEPYKFEIDKSGAVSQFKQAIRGGH